MAARDPSRTHAVRPAGILAFEGGGAEGRPVSFSEDRRQIVHVAMGGWALLLRWLTWPQAAALAVAALVFNTLVLPRIGGRSMYRTADLARGYPLGILLYPFVVLVLIVTFRQRLDLTAAAWGILAAGDGFATLVGQRLPE